MFPTLAGRPAYLSLRWSEENLFGGRWFYKRLAPNRAKSNRQRLTHSLLLEVELQRKLDKPRIVTRRDDAAEIARINNLPGVLIKKSRVEVADWISEVDTIE